MTTEDLVHLCGITKDRLVALMSIHPDLLTIEASSQVLFTRDEILVRGLMDALIHDHEVLETPADWWEAVKERWVPAWAKRRWPVKKRAWIVRTFCAHLLDAKREDHIGFLLNPPVESLL